MTNKEKVDLVVLLMKYHREEKEAAQGLVELKVREEAAEVILKHLNDMDTGHEEADLLMCLVQKHINDPWYLRAWSSHMHLRKRGFLPEQEKFLRWLGI